MGSIEPLKLVSKGDPWLWMAVFLGFIFIAVFYLMALTTQRLSVTVSSIAAKMSLAIPVLFSLFIFQIESKEFDWLNYLGIILAFLAIYLSSFKPKEVAKEGKLPIGNKWLALLPIGVFVGSGLIDTTINFTSFKYLSPREEAIFPIIIFGVAGVIGIILLLARRIPVGKAEWIGGIVLGVPNYFSVYFVVKGLAEFGNNGAYFYPLLNISIILGSSLAALILFREKLHKLNWLGLALAITAIALISYQEIFNAL
jgi:drug/metabolite transporter (DMT)-like permease